MCPDLSATRCCLLYLAGLVRTLAIAVFVSVIKNGDIVKLGVTVTYNICIRRCVDDDALSNRQVVSATKRCKTLLATRWNLFHVAD